MSNKNIPDDLNSMKYELYSNRCIMEYIQYYKGSSDDPEVNYISYNTSDNKFHIYTYFDTYPYKYISHIYSNETTKKYGTSMPILKLPWDKYPLDVTDIKAVSEKISILLPFV